jgi:hypothetical protein
MAVGPRRSGNGSLRAQDGFRGRRQVGFRKIPGPVAQIFEIWLDAKFISSEL